MAALVRVAKMPDEPGKPWDARLVGWLQDKGEPESRTWPRWRWMVQGFLVVGVLVIATTPHRTFLWYVLAVVAIAASFVNPVYDATEKPRRSRDEA